MMDCRATILTSCEKDNHENKFNIKDQTKLNQNQHNINKN